MTALYQRVREQLSFGWWVAIVLAIVGLLLTGVGFGSTFASYLFGETEYPSSTFAAATLTTPGTLTATASGNNVGLSWVAATNGNSYIVTGSDASAASLTSCTSANTYGTSIVTQAGTTYTDTGRGTATGVDNGDLYCYAIQNAYGTTWTSTGLSYGGTQVGYAATTLVLPKSGAAIGTADTIVSGATVKVTFNQTPGTNPSTAYFVCTFATTATILLGDSTATGTTNNCATTDTYTFGKLVLTGTGVSMTNSEKYKITSYSTTGDVVTLSIGALETGTTDTKINVPNGDTPTWTFTPPTTLTSSTGPVAACATNAHSNALCQPVTNTSF